MNIKNTILKIIIFINFFCFIDYLFIDPLSLIPDKESLFFETGSVYEVSIKVFSVFIGVLTIICLIGNLLLSLGFLTDKLKLANQSYQKTAYSVGLSFVYYIILNIGLWLFNSTYWIQLAFNVSNDRLTNISFIAFPYLLVIGLIFLSEEIDLKKKVKQCVLALLATFILIFNFNSLALPTVAKNFRWQNYFAVLNEPIYIINHNGFFYSYTTHIKTMADFTRHYSDFSKLYTTIMINRLTESETIQLVERYYMRFPGKRDSFLEKYSGELFSYTSLSKNLAIYERYEQADMDLIADYKKNGSKKIDEALKNEDNESPLIIAVEMSRTIKDK